MSEEKKFYTLTRKIGKTEYQFIVSLSDAARETFEDKLLRIVTNELNDHLNEEVENHASEEAESGPVLRGAL